MSVFYTLLCKLDFYFYLTSYMNRVICLCRSSRGTVNFSWQALLCVVSCCTVSSEFLAFNAGQWCCSTRTCSYFMTLSELWLTLSDITSINRWVYCTLE